MHTRILAALLVATMAVSGCSDDDDDNHDNKASSSQAQQPATVNGLRFIGEAVIPSQMGFNNTTVGGLSSIDYHDGSFYLISDDAATAEDGVDGPIRFYTAMLDFTGDQFHSADITSVNEILATDGTSFTAGQVDPESLRFDPNSGNFVWVSEGFINAGVAPVIREMDTEGQFVRDFSLPNLFTVSGTEGVGPRHNASFEGLSLSLNGLGYWVAMEGPLSQDGPAATQDDTDSAVRIAYIDRESGEFGRQFALELDPVTRFPAQPGFQFSVNGVVEILEYDQDQFLILERSFATNYEDGGNNVKIYRVDASAATDVSTLDSLADASIEKANKTLLFDFESIRPQLTDSIVDNIEGITFGPTLANGNRSLVLVADDNFSAFGPQLNQFLAFEVLESQPTPVAPVSVASLSFIGEQVLADGLVFENTTVGGLSGIDYANGVYYLISDDDNRDDTVDGPARFYSADLQFDQSNFSTVAITGVHEIHALDDTGEVVSYGARSVDPESIRMDPISGNLIWVNEGQVSALINPSIHEMGRFSEVVRDFALPNGFAIDSASEVVGPRHNVAFEGLTLSHDLAGFWVAMEGPLIQDGEAPTLEPAVSPVRVTYYDRQTGVSGRQFAYPLDAVVERPDATADAFRVSGLVEILAYQANQFLVLERSFTAGLADGGNNVKIYRVDTSEATDISAVASLQEAEYVAASKTLLLDFETLRNQLTGGVVDNIEGMTFGADLANGQKSLVVVADNNFSAFGPQLNQFVVFAVNP